MKPRRKVNENVNQVTPKNLRILCWQRGFHGVVGLANAIGRSRVTVHRAVSTPDQFGPTYRLIQEALAS